MPRRGIAFSHENRTRFTALRKPYPPSGPRFRHAWLDRTPGDKDIGGHAPLVRWQSGDAADCKSVYVGSIPARTSTPSAMIKLPGTGRLGFLFPKHN